MLHEEPSIVPDVEAANVVGELSRTWTSWKAARTGVEKEWDDAAYAYNTKYTEAELARLGSARARAYIPLVQEIVNTIQSALLGYLFPAGRRFFSLKSIGPEEAPQEALSEIEEFFDFYLKRMRFQRVISHALVPFIVYGNVGGVISWRTRTRKFPIQGKNRKIIKVPMVVYDGPQLDIVNPKDAVLDPSTQALSPDDFYIRRIEKSIYELREASSLYDKDAFKVLENAVEGLKVSTKTSAEEKAAGVATGLTDRVTVFVARGNFNIDGNTYENYIATVVVPVSDADSPSSGVLLQFQPDEADVKLYWGVYTEGLFTYLGRGAVAPLIGLQALTNTFACQKADLLSLILNGAWKAVPDPEFDLSAVEPLYPGQVIPVSDINNLQSLVPQSDITPALQELSYLRTEAQLSSGTSEFLFGSTTRVQGRRTAEEARFIQQGAAGRARGVLQSLIDGFLNPILNDMLYLLLITKISSNELDQALVVKYQYEVEFTGAETALLRQDELQNLLAYIDLLSKLQATVDPETLQRIRFLLGIERRPSEQLNIPPTIQRGGPEGGALPGVEAGTEIPPGTEGLLPSGAIPGEQP